MASSILSKRGFTPLQVEISNEKVTDTTSTMEAKNTPIY